MEMNWEQWKKDFAAVAEIGLNQEGGVDRLAYSEADNEAHERLSEMGRALGLEVYFDKAGNLWMTKKGSDSNQAPLVLGSHLDAVPNGGKYDGTLGVMIAFHVLRLLTEQGVMHKRDVTLVVFRGEESSRFNCATIGSKLLADYVSGQQLKRYEDHAGISPYDEIKKLGGDPDDLFRERDYLRSAYAFIEMHIEQGPVLESGDIDLGIVSHIAGNTRLQVIVQGEAAHSGACPMKLRHDALTGAAEIILAVEDLGRAAVDRKVVATVGKCNVHDQAINVVPGQVDIYIDVRGVGQDSIDAVSEEIRAKIKEISDRRELHSHVQLIDRKAPVELDFILADVLLRYFVSNHLTFLRMVSGAGHDCMNMAALTRSALVFLPCIKGISHNKLEAVQEEAIQNGIKMLFSAVAGICNSDPIAIAIQESVPRYEDENGNSY